jgi:glycosyltransferase involved in cell wall biosynthesis
VEIIEDGVNGLLVGHDASAVASAIAAILADRSLRDRLVAKARHDVEHYALPRVIERYDRLFQELAA